jgi:hypothetical protein
METYRAEEAEEAPQYVDIAFEGGRKARLDMTTSRAAVWADILDSLRQAGEPAYVEIDPASGDITELLRPLRVRVGALTPDATGDTVEVELIISAARHYLRATNPDFQELLSILQTAQQQGSTVLVTETLDDHEIIDVKLLPGPPGPEPAEEPPPVGPADTIPVTPQRAQQLFDLMNARSCAPATAQAPCIPFLYPNDGCWARAHEMCRLMLDDGAAPEKVWIYGWLRVPTINAPSCEVQWGWHVAPTLLVQVGSTTEVQVIDPSLFSMPVPQAVWAYVQGDPSATLVATNASVYHRSSFGTETYDPDYTQTEYYLQVYRDQLKLRAASASGPPPYSACYTPDLYIRDNLEDIGLEPLVRGGISRSPDINHFRQELLDPQSTLGNATAQRRDDLFEDVELGQPNYLYVRLQNRGTAGGEAEVDVYWTQPSTLPSPSSWHLIGSLQSPAPIEPDELEVIGPLEWNDIPASGHYCFVAVLGTAQDPKPDLNQIQSSSDFYQLIRESNNVTWKNFDVADMFAGSNMHFDFWVAGWPRIAYLSDLELDLSGLPAGSQVELRMLKRLTQSATLENLTEISDTKYHVRYEVGSARHSAVRRMPLRTSDRSQATLYLSLPDDTPDGTYEFSVLQRIDGREMGRITKRLAVGEHPYVVNRNSREVHAANCEWVSRMSPRNKAAYRDVSLALKRGYDGCFYCLPEHDTDRLDI